MATGKAGGKKKRWFEQFYPVWCTPVAPATATQNTGLQVYVTRETGPKKAQCHIVGQKK
jgi:hypothetical protein